jgi:hypothetical protein
VVVNSFLSVFLGLTVLAPPVAPAKDSEARAKLHALLDEAWEFDLREDPLFATSVGDRRFDDKLPSVRVADHARRAGARRKMLERLREIDPVGLDETDRDSWALQRVKLEDSIREFELHHYRFPINADSGFHMELVQLPRQMPFDTASSCCEMDCGRAGRSRRLRWRATRRRSRRTSLRNLAAAASSRRSPRSRPACPRAIARA